MSDNQEINMVPSNYIGSSFTDADLALLYRMKQAVDVVHEFYEWLCHDHRRTVIHKEFTTELKNVIIKVGAYLGPMAKTSLSDTFMFSVLRGIRDGLQDKEKRFPFNLEEVEREVVDQNKLLIALQELPIQEQAMWCGIWHTEAAPLPEWQANSLNLTRTEGVIGACDDALVLLDDISIISVLYKEEEWSDMSEAERGKLVLGAIQEMHVFEML